MAELLLFKWSHATQTVPAPSTRDLAGLPKRFDLITAQPDGWGWQKAELTNPWFRIIAWPRLNLSAVREFLSPLLPQVDANLKSTTYEQYRGFFLDMGNVAVPMALRTWWQDDTRSTPIFTTNISPVAVISVIRGARTAVPIALM